MSVNFLTVELKEFITRNILSVAQLELLLLFYSNPDRFWRYEELSNEMRTNVSAISKDVSQLLSFKSILKINDKYKFNSENQDIHLKVRQLFNVYKERPVAVITFMYERPSDVLQDFADAFKIKKD